MIKVIQRFKITDENLQGEQRIFKQIPFIMKLQEQYVKNLGRYLVILFYYYLR